MQPFSYHRPSSPEDAVAQVAPMGPAGQGGAFLAGGTTIVDLMKLHVVAPPSLTDIGALGLDAIEDRGDGTLHVGARVTMAAAAQHPAFRDRAPVLSDALWKAASPQLRNVATLGGNVLQRTRCPYFRDNVSPCNKRDPGSGCAAMDGINRLLAVLGTSDQCIASYAGDWANALILFDATVETLTADGGRDIAFADLHVPPQDHPERETILGDDELITGYRLQIPEWARRSVYVKARDRESYAFALASAAVALDMDGDTVREARLGLGGVATVPWRAREAEGFLAGKALTEDVATQAAQIAFQGAQGFGHNDFKIPLGQNTVVKALLDAAAIQLTEEAGQ
ncbi:MAG: FAD binding domain-containing protein [Paracoccus sp. (in: a-proteobacteria)]|uniref:FAD binding domain-containing protein n=1 Tax=Paracoccus sp. TaxID=267 RepID=UPI004059848C